MATDFRALCAEMAAELDHNRRCLLDDASLTHPLADRARAELAEPVAEPPAPPAEGEVAELIAQLRSRHYGPAALDRAAELLERHAAPVPVPVAERLPEPKDCDAEERCWLLAPRWILPPCEMTHWLPAHALPLPAPQGGEVEP